MFVKTFPEVTADPGIRRQVLSDSPDLMVVAFRFQQEGAEGKLHNHPHVQSTYVESGRFRFTIDAESFDVSPGDSLRHPLQRPARVRVPGTGNTGRHLHPAPRRLSLNTACTQGLCHADR